MEWEHRGAVDREREEEEDGGGEREVRDESLEELDGGRSELWMEYWVEGLSSVMSMSSCSLVV